MRRLATTLLATIASLVIIVGAAPVANAATAESIDIRARLSQEGILTVEQTMMIGEGVVSEVDSITQTLPTYADINGHRYVYTISDITLTGSGQSITPTISDGAGVKTISFPSNAGPEFVLSYTVSGATITALDGKVDFLWTLIQGLNFDVAKITGNVVVPPGAVNYRCSSGVSGAVRACSSFSGGMHGTAAMEFTDANRLAGEIVEVEVTFPVGPVAVTEALAPTWSLSRALSLGGTQVGIALGAFVVGGLLLFGAWRRTRVIGARTEPVRIAEFVQDTEGHVTFSTNQASRPGMVGTLVDSSVDPSDILSTILDLAQRGHLRITELSPETTHGVPDWTFTRLTVSDELKGYERELLDALTVGEVRVSALSLAIAPAIDAVQGSVYKEVISSGWFSRLPGKRSRWVPIAWVGLALALAATGVLVAFTSFGLVGIALVCLALIGLSLSFQSSPVTAQGAGVYKGLEELAQALHAQDPSAIEQKSRYAEISRILPYAVVLGSWDRWVTAMMTADADDTPDSEALPWYHAPKDWHMSYLPGSLDAFITVVTGRLFARA